MRLVKARYLRRLGCPLLALLQLFVSLVSCCRSARPRRITGAPFEASLTRLQISFRSVSCLHSSAGSLEGPIEGSYPPANVLLDPLLQEGWPADNQVSRYARSDSPSRHCITAPRSVLWQPELTPGPIIRSSVEQSIRPARTGLSVLRCWHP